MSYSVDLRERVLSFIARGGNKYEASEVFGISRATIYRWLSRESLVPSPRKTRQRRIDKTALRAHVQAHPDALLRERAIVFSVTPSGMWRAMQAQGLRKKNDEVC